MGTKLVELLIVISFGMFSSAVLLVLCVVLITQWYGLVTSVDLHCTSCMRLCDLSIFVSVYVSRTTGCTNIYLP